MRSERASWRRGGSGQQGQQEGNSEERRERLSPGALSLGGSVAAALLPPSASPRPRAVFRSWKPFLMSANRASMTHTSSCFPTPLLTERPQDPQIGCLRVPGAHPRGPETRTWRAWAVPPELRGRGMSTRTRRPGPTESPPKLSRRPHPAPLSLGPGLTRLPVLAPWPPGLLLGQLLLPPLRLRRLLLPVLVLLRGRTGSP